MELGVADGDRISGDDFTAEIGEDAGEDVDEAFGVGTAVMDGGDARDAHFAEDVMGSVGALVAIGRGGAVEAG